MCVMRMRDILKKKGVRLRLTLAAGLAAIGIMAGGCGMVRDNTEKLNNIDYTVLSPEEFPQELLETIDEKKAKTFRVTYSDGGYLYICVGYGQQPTGGYSICVDELYETANGIYIDTTLKGPQTGEDISQAASYPYIVVKIEDIGKSVIFN